MLRKISLARRGVVATKRTAGCGRSSSPPARLPALRQALHHRAQREERDGRRNDRHAFLLIRIAIDAAHSKRVTRLIDRLESIHSRPPLPPTTLGRHDAESEAAVRSLAS